VTQLGSVSRPQCSKSSRPKHQRGPRGPTRVAWARAPLCDIPKAESHTHGEADQGSFSCSFSCAVVVALGDDKHISLGELSTLAIDHESQGRSRELQHLAFDPAAWRIRNLGSLHVNRLISLQSPLKVSK
jgi:hypothetical protein